MRRIHLVTLVSVALVCGYLGWIYYARWSENRRFAQSIAEIKKARDHAIVGAYGGGQLKILAFYATPGTIRRGSKAQLCYGVSNSKSLRIEPPVGDIWPSFSRCVDVAPASDTEYKLIAEDAAGHRAIASTVVRVQMPK